jgi:hypothetical protein
LKLLLPYFVFLLLLFPNIQWLKWWRKTSEIIMERIERGNAFRNVTLNVFPFLWCCAIACWFENWILIYSSQHFRELFA